MNWEDDEETNEFIDQKAEIYVNAIKPHFPPDEFDWDFMDGYLTLFLIPFYRIEQRVALELEGEVDNERIEFVDPGRHYWAMDIVTGEYALTFMEMKKAEFDQFGIDVEELIVLFSGIPVWAWYRFCSAILKHSLLKYFGRKQTAKTSAYLRLFAPSNSETTAITQASIRQQGTKNVYYETTITQHPWHEMSHMEVIDAAIKNESSRTYIRNVMFLKTNYEKHDLEIEPNVVDDFGKLSNMLYAIRTFTDGPIYVASAYDQTELEILLRTTAWNTKAKDVRDRIDPEFAFEYRLCMAPDDLERGPLGVARIIRKGKPNQRMAIKSFYKGSQGGDVYIDQVSKLESERWGKPIQNIVKIINRGTN